MGRRIVFFLAGWALILAAFVAAALEGMARVQGAPGGLFLSAYDLWYTYWPANLVITQADVERSLDPAVWRWIIRPVLVLPAWFLLGGPGLAFIWFFRPARGVAEDGPDTHALYMFDELARRAREEGYGPDEDDMAPDHGGHDSLEADTEDDFRTVERLIAEADAEELARRAAPTEEDGPRPEDVKADARARTPGEGPDGPTSRAGEPAGPVRPPQD